MTTPLTAVAVTLPETEPVTSFKMLAVTTVVLSEVAMLLKRSRTYRLGWLARFSPLKAPTTLPPRVVTLAGIA